MIAEGKLSITAVAQAALGRWAGLDGARPELVNHSENHMFRVEAGERRRFALRLGRPGYQTFRSAQSEVVWLEALGRATGLPVPRPVAGRDGELVQEAAGRLAVLFEWLPGELARPDGDLRALFPVLGRYAAVAHRHAEHFRPPVGFVRQRWDAGAVLGPAPLWGDWRDGPGVAGEIRAVLERLATRLMADLAAYGTGAHRFGLIHADMRLGNLLIDGDRVVLLDFDDCGFGWYLYDLAASLSFIETTPDVPDLAGAWLDSYRSVRPLSADDVAMVEPLILFRRMALLAWIGSHAETDLARAQEDRFALDTAHLADKYLVR